MPPMPKTNDHPGLRAFTFHGADLAVHSVQASGECVFCTKPKFYANVEDTKWQCFSCGLSGNALAFARTVHEISTNNSNSEFYSQAQKDRRLFYADTLRAWGVCQSAAPGRPWLVAGYGPDKRERMVINQVYKRAWLSEEGKAGWRLLPTPGVWPEGEAHALHLCLDDFDLARDVMVVCEGPWDGMALWEVRESLRSELGDCNVIAVPGCNVWRDKWTALCKGKRVYLLYDSDHPRTEHGRTYRSGFDGMQRVASKLSGHADKVYYLKWGEDGYDPTRPNGWDVRDALTGTMKTPLSLKMRKNNLAGLLLRVEEAPQDWFSGTHPGDPAQAKSTEAKECNDWLTCEESWKEAVFWREDLGNALSVLLAVCASTNQSGNQIFMDLIGIPGGLKTTLCKGLLVSHHCIHLENMTKIISGHKKAKDPDKDCSFLARANNKTWVTCEFDTLGASHQYHELMSKMRRIFDGETSATYGNSDIDRIYSALRTPWIRAGTPRMMDHDQSSLGDRFLRFILKDPAEDERFAIAMAALDNECAANENVATGMGSSLVNPRLRKAHALTGGYVNWLRAHAEESIRKVDFSTDMRRRCVELSVMCADLRARPADTKTRKDDHDPYKEMPTRLSEQHGRLARHLAFVLNKTSVDDDVMRVIKKVALDTAHGNSLKIVGWLCDRHDRKGKIYQEAGGIPVRTMQQWLETCGMNAERSDAYLNFLRKIGVLRMDSLGYTRSWLLTDRVYELYGRISKW